MGTVATLRAGDVVVADFPGVVATKRRPAVVLSTELYHNNRPDVLLGAITTNLAAAATPMDHTLVDWAIAGLHRPSAFRSFLVTLPKALSAKRCDTGDGSERADGRSGAPAERSLGGVRIEESDI
jgi:mRNA interferase MazF